MNPKLPCHEWLIILLIVAITLTLVSVAYIRDRESLPRTGVPHAVIPNEIEVEINGAVENPGKYTFKKGAVLGELIEQAHLMPEADQRRLNFNRKLKDGQHVYISFKPKITVYMTGAVKNPGPIEIPEGARLEDLKHFVSFLPEADDKVIQKKRKVKDQEIIEIPRLYQNREFGKKTP